MKFDPDAYTIIIRKEDVDGEDFFVGRVAEFPNISAFEDTFESARALVVDAINTLKQIADKTQSELPLPYPAPVDEFSGRVTLRFPKSLHAKVSVLASKEDVSVNQYLVTAIASYVGEIDGISKVVSEAANVFLNAVKTATALSWKGCDFKFMNEPPAVLTIPSDIAGTKVLIAGSSQSLYTGATYD